MALMVSIQPVTCAQLPKLLELIGELALFERLEHEMKATVASLEDSFFGARPAAGALLAFSEENAVGYAIYFWTFSSFVGGRGIWLEDVYVQPAHRRQGIGKALIKAVARIGVDNNCGRFEWTALDWNENALNFYKQLGARTLDDWVLLRTDAAGMKRIAEIS